MLRRTFPAALALATLAALSASLPAARSSRDVKATTARAAVATSRIVVRGKPFFPVMLIDQCTADAARRARKLGINLIVNEACPKLAAPRQLRAIERHALAVLPIAAKRVRGPALVGWTFPDEPETNGWTPARLKRANPYRRGNSDGLLSFMTTGAGFFRSSYTPAISQLLYRDYARLADVAGFDLYPLGHCSADLAAVYDAQRAFNHIVGPMPTFQWIETGPIRPQYCGGFKMEPAELRAEVWLAIAGGARGIGYFTHTWSPKHRAFDVRPPVRRAIAKANDLIAAVRPGLLGKTVLSGADSPSVKVLARLGDDGKTYVIAVNAARAPINVQLHVPALRDGAVRAFGEKRSVTARRDRIWDTFPPLGVHIYVQKT